MVYGYYNYYITGIGENVGEIVLELKKFSDKVVTEELSYSPKFYEMVAQAKPGDTVCVYNIKRSCGGLRDLVDILKLLNAKNVKFKSIQDGIVVDKTEQGQAVLNSLQVAAQLINTDPLHGFFK